MYVKIQNHVAQYKIPNQYIQAQTDIATVVLARRESQE